jgi:putative tryptophan/tyrosine transport system substrate-binding protein
MRHRIGRRRFLTLGTAFVALRVTASAQTAGGVHRIGVLGVTSPKVHGRFVDAFREGLTERGYVEGKNLMIEYRWAEGNYSRLPELAAELTRLPVDLILTHGTPGGRAAKAATATIPIVIAMTGDAVTTGLVQSLAHPGGNLTGVTFFFAEVNAKRVELVKEAFPPIKRVAVLMNGDNPGNMLTFEAMARMARSLGLQVFQVVAHSPSELEVAFAQIARARAEAVSIYEDPLFTAQAPQLAALAERDRLRSIGFREYAEAGGLLGFGIDFAHAWRRAAGFADRIFKGAKPGDLPMEQPSKYDTVVNLRTARALGVTVPRTVVLRADTLIEN